LERVSRGLFEFAWRGWGNKLKTDIWQ